MIEKRIAAKKNEKKKSALLPVDYTKLVKQVLTTTFAEGLERLGKIKPDPSIEVQGEIFPDEIVVVASLHHGAKLAATSVYASVAFDPKASSPTAEELLAACVDAIGGFFQEFLSSEKPEKMKQIADE